jgi:hypothetical protein
MVCAKTDWCASQILRVAKWIEALKMNKYLHPGYFFIGSHRSTHDQKSSRSSIKKLVRPGCQITSSMHECRRRRNAPTSHALLMLLLRQSRHVSYVAMTSWCVEWLGLVQMTSSLFMRVCVSTCSRDSSNRLGWQVGEWCGTFFRIRGCIYFLLRMILNVCFC